MTAALQAVAILFALILPRSAPAEIPWHPYPPGSEVRNPPFPRDDGKFVALAFDRLLGRPPLPAEVREWTDLLQRGEARRRQLVMSLLSSDEYFLRRLFLDLLDREPGDEERDVRLRYLADGGRREDVLRNVLESPEYRATLR